MQINCSITVEADETFTLTSEQAAVAVLEALDGDPATDYCAVYVMASPTPGMAGRSPNMPSSPEMDNTLPEPEPEA